MTHNRCPVSSNGDHSTARRRVQIALKTPSTQAHVTCSLFGRQEFDLGYNVEYTNVSTVISVCSSAAAACSFPSYFLTNSRTGRPLVCTHDLAHDAPDLSPSRSQSASERAAGVTFRTPHTAVTDVPLAGLDGSETTPSPQGGPGAITPGATSRAASSPWQRANQTRASSPTAPMARAGCSRHAPRARGS